MFEHLYVEMTFIPEQPSQNEATHAHDDAETIGVVLAASMKAMQRAGFTFDNRLPIPHLIRRIETLTTGAVTLEQAAEAIRDFVQQELPALNEEHIGMDQIQACALVIQDEHSVSLGSLPSSMDHAARTLVDAEFLPRRVVCIHQGKPHLLAFYNARPTTNQAAAYEVITCTSGAIQMLPEP